MYYKCCANAVHTTFTKRLYNNYGDYMRKFKIPSNPPTTNKTIRFPNDVIENVEKAIQGKNCTFTAFVVEAARVALENYNESEE